MKINIEQLKKEKPISELLEFGIINIDKPSGPTSFNVSDFVRKKLGLRKTSHFGTLDPKVTGVLPIALNRACKLTGYFIGHDKEYVGIMRVHEEIDMKKVQEIINKKFLGKIKQTPPVKSRVARREREREIKSFKLLEQDKKDIVFRTEVQGGTYIRKLCLHKDTEILTLEGIRRIEDFVPIPLPIYSKRGDSCEITVPSETQKIRSPSKLLRIKTSSGIHFTITPDHKLLISTTSGYKMKQAEKLTTNDYLVKSSRFYHPSKEYCILDLLDDDYLIEQTEIKKKCKESMIKKFGSIRAMSKKTGLDRKVFLTKSKNSISIKHLKVSGIYDEIKQRVFRFKTQKGRIIEMKNLSKKHLYLLGLIASDGNNTREKKTRRYTRIKFHNKEEKLVDKFINIYSRLFPTVPISKKKIKENLFELDSSNSLFATIAAKLGILSPEKKSDLLPILYCDNRLIKSFLRGYFDGDGNAYYAKKNNGNGAYSDIRIYCAYYLLIKRIHQMLLKLGIHNKIIKSQTNFGQIFIAHIIDLESKRKFASEVGSFHPLKKNYLKSIFSHRKTNYEDYRYIPFHYKDNLRKYKNKLSLLGGNLGRILNSSVPLTLRFYKKASSIIPLPKLGDFIIEKIKEIEITDGKGYVYDMTIPKTHNFLIETGFVSSNCDDLGKELGVGAHMLELRRTRAGIFSEDKSVNLYEFEKAVEKLPAHLRSQININVNNKKSEGSSLTNKRGDLINNSIQGRWVGDGGGLIKSQSDKEELLRNIIIPAEEAIKKVYPVMKIKKDNLNYILTGKAITKKDLTKVEKFKVGEIVGCFCGERFVGMYKIIDEEFKYAKPEFVMQEIKG